MVRQITVGWLFVRADQTRFNVTAGGDIPQPRAFLCSVVSSSNDTTFQMITYGGDSIVNLRSYSDVFVLSMPTFTWVKIKDTGNPDQILTDRPVGRSSHTCESYGDRQMIVLVGSIEIDNDSVNNVSCNASHGAIAVLDTTTFQWQQTFNPKPAAYTVSDQLQGLE